MNNKIAYKCKTIGSPLVFYYYPASKKTSWLYSPDSIIVNPPDGFSINPPEIQQTNIPLSRTKSAFARSRTLTINQYYDNPDKDFRIQNKFLKKRNSSNSQNYFDISNNNSFKFMKIPFFPTDMFILYNSAEIKNKFNEMINYSHFQIKNQSSYKESMIDLIFHPLIHKSITGTLLLDTPSIDYSKSVESLISLCKSYIKSPDHTKIVDIISKLNENNKIMPDIIFYILIQTNSISTKQTVKNSWILFIILISSIRINHSKLLKLIRSYLAIVSNYYVSLSQSISAYKEIQNLAFYCLFRLSCFDDNPNLDFEEFSDNSIDQMMIIETSNDFYYLPNFDYDKTAPLLYFQTCYSTSMLFGVSLSEVLYKERIQTNNTLKKKKTLVPSIVRKLITQMIQKGAFSTKRLFIQKSGSKTEKLNLIQQINNGNMDLESCNIHTIASTLMHFLKNLQSPLLPYKDVVENITDTIQIYQCLNLVNYLPNENKDTLMYLIGFFQQMVNYEKTTMVGAQSLADQFALKMARLPKENMSSDEIKQFSNGISRFLFFLISEWITDDVYPSLDDD